MKTMIVYLKCLKKHKDDYPNALDYDGNWVEYVEAIEKWEKEHGKEK